MFQCAGGCGGSVRPDEIFCEGCRWVISDQARLDVADRFTATIAQPRIGFTTDPYFQKVAG